MTRTYKQRMLQSIAALSVLLIFLCTGSTAPAHLAAVPASAAAALKEGAAQAHTPALGAVIVSSSEVLFEEIYGSGASANTPFVLGSLSKSFTALAVMTLAEQGLIDLDAPAVQYVPNVRTHATIRQLLTHTSGISTYDTPQDYRSERKNIGTHIYSNMNYALLGKVIEAVTGMKYDKYIEETILVPLGMTNTYAKPSEAAANGLVQGYTNMFGLNVRAMPPAPDQHSWIQPAAGYISSSLSDMVAYLQMYLRGGEGIVSEAGIDQMLNDGVEVDADIPYRYAFGWNRIDAPLPVPVYRHAGLTETSMTCMYLIPSMDLGIALLANSCDYLVGTDLLDRIGWNLVLEILGESSAQIEQGAYARSHTMWNLIYVGFLSTAAVPFLFIGRSLRGKKGPRTRKAITGIVLYYFAYPTALLLLVPLMSGVPLWVIGDFVPDLYSILIATAVLLYVGGAIRLAVPPLRNLHAGAQ